jgi:hypothetical protein
MQCDIDSFTILKAAIKSYGEGVQVGNVMWLDTLEEYIVVNITPTRSRSFRGKFYYRKNSFDYKEDDN